MKSNLGIINNNFTKEELVLNRMEGLKKALLDTDDVFIDELIGLVCWYNENFVEHPNFDMMNNALMVALVYYEAGLINEKN